MEVALKTLDETAYRELLSVAETHFIDLKGVEIAPSKLTKTISAFANTGGGEIFVGVDEFEGVSGKERAWNGFKDQEAANAIF